jgi:hypothetical protein
MNDDHPADEKHDDASVHDSRVFGGGGRQMVDPPIRLHREGRSVGPRTGAPESAKPVYILLAIAAAALGLVALGLNL